MFPVCNLMQQRTNLSGKNKKSELLQVMLFDIRSNKPTLVKDHHYEFPIHSIQFLTDTDENRLVLSCDKKGVKAWHQESGDLVTAIEPSDCEINHMQLYPSSGLVFLAAETQKIHAYFVPVCCFLCLNVLNTEV